MGEVTLSLGGKWKQIEEERSQSLSKIAHLENELSAVRANLSSSLVSNRDNVDRLSVAVSDLRRVTESNGILQGQIREQLRINQARDVQLAEMRAESESDKLSASALEERLRAAEAALQERNTEVTKLRAQLLASEEDLRAVTEHDAEMDRRFKRMSVEYDKQRDYVIVLTKVREQREKQLAKIIVNNTELKKELENRKYNNNNNNNSNNNNNNKREGEKEKEKERERERAPVRIKTNIRKPQYPSPLDNKKAKDAKQKQTTKAGVAVPARAPSRVLKVFLDDDDDDDEYENGDRGKHNSSRDNPSDDGDDYDDDDNDDDGNESGEDGPSFVSSSSSALKKRLNRYKEKNKLMQEKIAELEKCVGIYRVRSRTLVSRFRNSACTRSLLTRTVSSLRSNYSACLDAIAESLHAIDGDGDGDRDCDVVGDGDGHEYDRRSANANANLKQRLHTVRRLLMTVLADQQSNDAENENDSYKENVIDVENPHNDGTNYSKRSGNSNRSSSSNLSVSNLSTHRGHRRQGQGHGRAHIDTRANEFMKTVQQEPWVHVRK